MQGEIDIGVTCRDCGREFLFTRSEQEFYKEKGFLPPLRCKECRSRRNHPGPVLCSRCGTELTRDGSACCNACVTAQQADSELKAASLQRIVDEADTRLRANEIEKALLLDDARASMSTLESEKKHLEALVQESEKTIANLNQQLEAAGQELEKARKQWVIVDSLEPALENMRKKVEALEKSQRGMNEAMLKLVQRVDGRGLFDSIKRVLTSRHKSAAQDTARS